MKQDTEIEFTEKVKKLWLSGDASLDKVLKMTVDFMDHIGGFDKSDYDQVFVARMLRYLLDSQIAKLTPKGKGVFILPKSKLEEAIIGEATDRFYGLDNVRIRTIFTDFDNKTGTIYLVYINSTTKVVQIWTNMEDDRGKIFGAWGLDPNDIELMDAEPEKIELLKKLQDLVYKKNLIEDCCEDFA